MSSELLEIGRCRSLANEFGSSLLSIRKWKQACERKLPTFELRLILYTIKTSTWKLIGKVHGALTYLSIARNKGEKEVHTISCNHTIFPFLRCIRSCSIRRESYKEANLTRISPALMSQLKLCFRYRFYYFLTPWCLVPWLSLPIPRLFCLCLYDLGSFRSLRFFLSRKR